MENQNQIHEQKQRPGMTVAFRVKADLRDFYIERAKADRRKLSDVLRMALEDHAQELQQREEEAA